MAGCFPPRKDTLPGWLVDQHGCGDISLLRVPWTNGSGSFMVLEYWILGSEESKGIRLGVEKNWEMSQNGGNCLQGSSTPNWSLGRGSWRDFGQKPWIKRPRNDSTQAKNVSTQRSWPPARGAWDLDCSQPQRRQGTGCAPRLVQGELLSSIKPVRESLCNYLLYQVWKITYRFLIRSWTPQPVLSFEK